MAVPVSPLAEPAILAVDLGTSGCKVAVVTATGRVAGWAFRPVSLVLVEGAGAEQRPDDWWRAFVEAGRQALRDADIPRARVVAVCASTQGEGTVAVDRDGRALMNGVIWMDMRGAPSVRRRMRGLLKVAGYDALKLQRWLRLCGGAPALSGKDPFGHMLFIRDHRPAVYEKTHKFLNVLDYLVLRLTGRFVATQDSILTSWVTDNRDVNAIRYDAGLLRLSGIDREKFPDLVRCTDVVGPLLPAVAEDLGLLPETRVIAGAIDNSAAAVGAGTVADYDAHLYVGSSSWVAAHVPFKKTSVVDQIASVPCALPSKYLMMALQTSGANSIAFLKDRIIFHDDGLVDSEPSPDIYAVLDAIAARTSPGSDGLVYLPWLFGERCPVDDRSLRAGLFNLSIEHSRETLVRAVFEGTALNTRWMMKPVERFLGRRPPHLTIIGGGGLSAAWCQIYADVLDMPIRQPREPLKANALGAAMIAAVGLGLTSFAAASAWAGIGRTYEPDPRLRRLYDDRFGLFRDLHRRLTPVYRRLNGGEGAGRG
ncbi:FGGY-family carbohydrate kinase [Rhizobium sp. TRM95111]|uniref:xylulokinase n=1 Tax=Rhizobium alarense TaxID=2846851 RepID=UPI001F45A64F|nr:FGGY-family carbohydrate kinase [Rhizobium alarense]MCF3641279.1 FGGY-family carbohydrate kinase [Rhizobium alarense]